MEIRIKLNKQMLATAKLAAIMSMPEETEKINKYLNEESEEVVDLDVSLLEKKVQQQMAVMFGMFVMSQKATAEDEEDGQGTQGVPKGNDLEFNALNYAESVAEANDIPENVKNLLVTAYIAGANRV